MGGNVAQQANIAFMFSPRQVDDFDVPDDTAFVQQQ